MRKFTLFIALIALLTSCSKEDKVLETYVPDNPLKEGYESSIHPSILNSTWWQEKSTLSKELHSIELSDPDQLKTYSDIREMQNLKRSLVRDLQNNTRGPKVSPGYPSPNPEGNVTLTTQADVDAFGAMGYKTITGFLEINDTIPTSPICDLSPLSKIKEVGSYLLISASCVTDLDGLSKIKSVGELGPFGYIAVRCNNVTDINALRNIKTITGSINLIDNFNLTSLGMAFKNITSIESGKTAATINSLYVLNMFGNTTLNDLGGLGNLVTIERNFLFRENDALTDLDGFTSLNSIGNLIAIENNAALQNVNKLSVVPSLTTGLIVQDNLALTDCCGLYHLVCSNPPACTTSGAPVYIIFNNGAGCTDLDIISNGPC